MSSSLCRTRCKISRPLAGLHCIWGSSVRATNGRTRCKTSHLPQLAPRIEGNVSSLGWAQPGQVAVLA